MTDTHRLILLSTLVLTVAFCGAKPGVCQPPQPNSTPPATDDTATGDTASVVTEDQEDSASGANRDEKLVFSFDNAPWDRVIHWLAEEANLSLQMDKAPTGTFNYFDDQEYSVAEALDLVNKRLSTMDFTLVRNRRQLIVIDLAADSLPRQLVDIVTPEQLDQRGKSEFLICFFTVEPPLVASEFAEDIRKLAERGFGELDVVESANKIMVLQKGDVLRTIRDHLAQAHKQATQSSETYVLKNVPPQIAIERVRPLMGIEADKQGNEEGTLRFSVDEFGSRIYFRGTPEMVRQFKGALAQVDIPPDDIPIGPIEQRYIHHYKSRDPEMAKTILSASLASRKDSMILDVIDGSLVVFGRKEDHEAVAKMLEQLPQRTTEMAAIPLRTYEAAEMITLINQMLGLDTITTDQTAAATEGPNLSEDPKRNQLLVRGTPQQVEEVKEIVHKLDPPLGAAGADRTRYRIIQMNGRSAERAIETIRQIWPATGRQNKLQFVIPNRPESGLPQRRITPLQRELPPAAPDSTSDDAPKATPPPSSDRASGDGLDVARRDPRIQPLFVAYRQDGRDPQLGGDPPDDIIVTVTPTGIIIQSDDLDALDALEELLRSRASNDLPALPTVFYLENISAGQAFTLLQGMLGLDAGGSGGGLGGFFGGVAQRAIGGPAGDLVGGLLGGGGGGNEPLGTGSGVIQTAEEVNIVPDARLNALIIQAGAEDMDLILNLLQYIDQPEAPQNPNTIGKTYVIQVSYMSAETLAEIIRGQMGDSIKSPQSNQQGGGRNSAEQQILQALMRGGGRGRRGGGGGGGGGNTRDPVEAQKVAIGVDVRSNTILVTGPKYLCDQVQDIVKQMDREELMNSESYAVVRVDGKVNAEILRNSLQSIFGENLRVSNSNQANRGQQGTQNRSNNGQGFRQFGRGQFPGFNQGRGRGNNRGNAGRGNNRNQGGNRGGGNRGNRGGGNNRGGR